MTNFLYIIPYNDCKHLQRKRPPISQQADQGDIKQLCLGGGNIFLLECFMSEGFPVLHGPGPTNVLLECKMSKIASHTELSCSDKARIFFYVPC